MKKLCVFLVFMWGVLPLLAQNNIGRIDQHASGQFAEILQPTSSSDAYILQTSEAEGKQSAWVLQIGDAEAEQGGKNISRVEQHSTGDSENKSFVFQLGSSNKAYQYQTGKGNEFNIFEGFTGNLAAIAVDNSLAVPNQDGDFMQFTQRVVGDFNKASFYQAGRASTGEQEITGNLNEVLTTQSGNGQSSLIIINGNNNGSHYLVHGEGKFPHDESEEETEHGDVGPGKGKGKGGQTVNGDGGPPEVIPPEHEDDHEFVPSVGVAIKQMGKGSYASIDIDGNDNKAQIVQRGGSCVEEGGGQGNGNGNASGNSYNHEAYQTIVGDWNRIFADQRGKNHYSNQTINGYENLVTSIQRGNGSTSTIDVDGSYNEVGVDQKGKGNISDIDISGQYNGNLDIVNDEYGIMLTQEGKGNISTMDIYGNSNASNVYQNGGNTSTVLVSGNFNQISVNQIAEESSH